MLAGGAGGVGGTGAGGVGVGAWYAGARGGGVEPRRSVSGNDGGCGRWFLSVIGLHHVGCREGEQT
ncbi:hypothetical protein CA237_01125 [Sphingomonas sp. ABOLH]|nr:hypothetical protein CA237_01125 [Sphingomonas sp. ABOLH]